MEEFRGLQDQIYIQVRGQSYAFAPSLFTLYRQKRGLGLPGQCRNFFFIPSHSKKGKGTHLFGEI